MSIEKMKQWLEALITAEAGLADIGDADREPGDDLAWCEARAAQALSAPRSAITSLRQAIEQAEKQEPVAWVDVHDYTNLYYRKPAQVDVVPLYYGYTTPQPQQAEKQPDYSICPTCGGMADDPIVPPHHRKPNLEWVGLDYDDIDALGLSIAKARAVEALLKGRNT